MSRGVVSGMISRGADVRLVASAHNHAAAVHIRYVRVIAPVYQLYVLPPHVQTSVRTSREGYIPDVRDPRPSPCRLFGPIAPRQAGRIIQ